MAHLLQHRDWASSPLGSGLVGEVTRYNERLKASKESDRSCERGATARTRCGQIHWQPAAGDRGPILPARRGWGRIVIAGQYPGTDGETSRAGAPSVEIPMRSRAGFACKNILVWHYIFCAIFEQVFSCA